MPTDARKMYEIRHEKGLPENESGLGFAGNQIGCGRGKMLHFNARLAGIIPIAATLILGLASTASAQQPNITVGGMLQQRDKASLTCATSPKYESRGCGSVAPKELSSWTPPLPSDCPKGTFFDSAFGGECWTCPSGHIRSTKEVWGPEACWKAVTEEVSAATFVQKHGCPSGSFFDLYNGGSCWSCPSGHKRTLDHITWKTACSKGIFGPFSHAKSHGSASDCPSGSFFDLINGGTCWSCPDDFRRTANPVDTNAACAKTIPTQYARASMHSNLGCAGHLWSPGLPRPFANVLNRKCYACPTVDNETGEILIADKGIGSDSYTCAILARWMPSVPASPRWQADLAAELLNDPELVTQYLKSVAEDEGVRSVDDFVETEWRQIAAEPANNRHLRAMIFTRLMIEAQLPDSERSPAGKALVESLATFIQSRETAAAQDALDMFRAWKQQMEHLKATARARGSLEIAFDYGDVPPRFDHAARFKLALDQQGYSAFVELGNSVNFMSSLTAAGLASRDFFLVAHRGKQYGDAALNLFKTMNVSMRVLRHGRNAFNVYSSFLHSQTAIRGAVTAANVAGRTVAAGSAAAFVVGIFASAVLEKVTSDVILMATMEPNLQAALTAAKRTPDLRAMARDNPTVAAYWYSKMMEYPWTTTPALTSSAQAAAKSAAANDYYPVLAWLNFGGPGSDAGVGEDGSLWVIGAQESIWRFPKGGKGWEGIPGASIRVAAGAGNDAWVVNSLGRVYSWTGSSWLPVCLEAAPLGQGACGGVFPAMDVGIASDGTVFVSNRKGQLFQKQPSGGSPVWSSGDKLQLVTAAIPAPVRVDAGKSGVAIVTDKRVIAVLQNGRVTMLGPLPLRNRPGSSVPDPTSVITADVAIGPNGTYWAVSESGHIYSRAPGAAQWTEPTITGTPPGTMKAISVGEPLQPTVLTKEDSIHRIVRK